MNKRLALGAAVGICLAGLIWGRHVTAQTGGAAEGGARLGTAGVSRVVLGSGIPDAAPGHELSIRRVTFAPGAHIPGEIHPGMQIVYVVSGTLGLTVKGGQAEVRRALPGGAQGPVEVIAAGPSEVLVRAGDTVLEPETLVLSPRNAGNAPLIILAAALAPPGQPQSVPITQSITLP